MVVVVVWAFRVVARIIAARDVPARRVMMTMARADRRTAFPDGIGAVSLFQFGDVEKWFYIVSIEAVKASLKPSAFSIAASKAPVYTEIWPGYTDLMTESCFSWCMATLRLRNIRLFLVTI